MAQQNLPVGSRSLEECRGFLMAQLGIAKSWQEKAEHTQDVFAQFFFLYTAFNALYFAWNKVGPKKNNEKDQIEHLLEKMPLDHADDVLGAAAAEIEFFLERRPIQQMKYRNCDRPSAGPDSEGSKARESLKPVKPASERLAALGEIIYYVRCNLVHGSKEERGDDEAVITMAVGPLRHILEATIAYTEQELRSQ